MSGDTASNRVIRSLIHTQRQRELKETTSFHSMASGITSPGARGNGMRQDRYCTVFTWGRETKSRNSAVMQILNIVATTKFA